MKELRLAGQIIKTLLKDRLQYSGRLITDTITMATRCGVLLLLYYYVFNLKGGSVNGTPYLIAAWSIFSYFAFMSLGLRNISKLIMADVQSGNVEVLFNKPISYLLYRVWWQIGSGLYSFLLLSFLGIVSLALIIGFPETMKIGLYLPTLFLVFFGGLILSLLIYIIVGLFSFWVEDINPIYWLVDKSIMILGGSYLPVALFPDFLYKISVYSPFGASQFITHAVYSSWQSRWYLLISIQIVWIIALGSLTYYLFNKAKKKISVNGG
jgi:ABC-2 type transport system permease protein